MRAIVFMVLKVFDSSPITVKRLADVFADCPSVEVVMTKNVIFYQPPPGLDVLYLPLAAAERWGAVPLIHRSQILKTSPSEQQNGLPPLIATGTCLAPDDPRGPVPETSLLVSAVFQAIREYDAENKDRNYVVGFWAVDLLRMVNPIELRKILKDLVPELKISG